MKNTAAIILSLVLTLPGLAVAADDWVAQSDENARLLLDVLARFAPEGAGALGVDGLDEEIFDLKPKLYERSQKASTDVLRKLKKRLEKEDDPRVRQDIEILIQATEDNLLTSRLQREMTLPYFNVTQNVFQGIRALIDPQVPAERYPAAVVRLRRYAGMERGYKPITEHAKARSSERFDAEGLIGPYRGSSRFRDWFSNDMARDASICFILTGLS